MLMGGLCVYVFFVISGFYMALILTQRYDAKAHLKMFYLNRFLRIYPTYWFVLALAICYYCVCNYITSGKTPEPVLFAISLHVNIWQTAAMWFANITLFGHDLMHCFHWSPVSGFSFLAYQATNHPSGVFWLGDATWISPAWSLGVEVVFYCMVPFIYDKSKAFLVSFAGVSIFSFWYLNQYTVGGAYFVGFSSIWMFVLGIFGFRFYQWAKPLFQKITCKPLQAFVYSSPIAWVVLFPSIFKSDLNLVVVILVGALSVPLLFFISERSSIDRLIGNLSYPLYISHELVSGAVASATHRFQIGVRTQAWLEIVASIIFASFLYFLFDRCFEQLRSRNVSQAVKPA